MNISMLENCYAYCSAAILGGGPSLSSDLSRIPLPKSAGFGEGSGEGLLLFGCNDHALHVGIMPDYLVVNDDPACKPHLLQAVREFKGLVISPNKEYSDIDLSGVDYWHDLTSMTACWLADFMGCAPIYLCGMDLYQGDVKYCHDKDDGITKAIYDRTLEQHINHWRKAFEKLPHPERLHAVSGPLMALFPQGISEPAGV
jgi:hypothetical protein